MRKTLYVSKALTFVIPCLLLLASQSGRAQFSMMPSEDHERQVAIRQAGLHGDRTQIAAMMQMLQSPPDSKYPGVADRLRMSLLHTLAQLGVIDALLAMDAVIRDKEASPDVATYAQVAKARAVAENGARALTGKSQITAKISRFLLELGLTPSSINEGVAAYGVQRQAWRANVHASDTPAPPTPLEVMALREIADMAYQGPYPAFAASPEVCQLDFQSDAAAALKMRLAPLSREKRIATMIEELAQETKDGPTETYTKQLLVDEGTPARQAVFARVKEMSAHPSQYTNPLTQRLVEGNRALYDVYSSISADEGVLQTPANQAATSAGNAKPNRVGIQADIAHIRVYEKMRRQFATDHPGF